MERRASEIFENILSMQRTDFIHTPDTQASIETFEDCLFEILFFL